jgi:hypothetical protein
VNELVILPDIEKRLEAFVRLGHSFIVFPGGAGTMEEILYLLGLAMHEDNRDNPLPVIFAAPESGKDYFTVIDRFLRNALGDEAADYYEIVIGNPEQVAQLTRRNLNRVMAHRRQSHESYAFNWGLTIPESMQIPFIPTHESMAALNLDPTLPKGELVAQLRCAFSGIVAGNVKADGIRQIERHGPFQLSGDPALVESMALVLEDFISARRMKLSSEDYRPCFELARV